MLAVHFALERQQIESPLVTLALFEIRDQLAKLRVSRAKRGHLAGMAKRCRDISSGLRNRDERHQYLTVGRMRHCFALGAGRVQRNGVDIGIAGVVGSQFAGLPKQIQRPTKNKMPLAPEGLHLGFGGGTGRPNVDVMPKPTSWSRINRTLGQAIDA
jgi:hypothetical protein